ncbi:RNA polymerase sigma factor [Streptomyces sp. NPDC091266]|uniref:RNA polymerase sigma factor n=1 Tax=Streptomyces sp. NPDC091266 TaxID=3365978 RepID=UPI0038158D95
MTQRKQRPQRPRRAQRKQQPERHATPEANGSGSGSEDGSGSTPTAPDATPAPDLTGDGTTATHPARGSEGDSTPAPDTSPDAAPGDTTERAPGQAAAAFDALYTRHAAALIRQVVLLTGRPRLSQQAVERAFQLAWQRWPEVAVDPDPAGWVRAAAYEYALSPWHRLRPGHRSAEKTSPKAPAPATAPEDRALLDTMLGLPAPYRRTLLLHDGVGLGLYETAAEIEASTPAAAGRLTHAREKVAERLPELGLGALPPLRQGEILHARLTELAAAQPVAPPGARAVRSGSERFTTRTTRAALGLTGLIALATVIVLFTTPDGYTPPVKEQPASSSTAAPDEAASPGARTGHGGADDTTGTDPDAEAAPPSAAPSDDPGNAAVQDLPPGARLVPEFR